MEVLPPNSRIVGEGEITTLSAYGAIKSSSRHEEVRPLKCIVYITHNPVTFEIHRRREFYLLDQ